MYIRIWYIRIAENFLITNKFDEGLAWFLSFSTIVSILDVYQEQYRLSLS